MLFKSCADKSARPHQLIPNLEDRTLNWGTNVFWWYHSSPESSLPPSTAGPCPLSINPRLLVWEVGCQERSPPERGRLRRTLGMRSLPARGLNIVVMGYRADVYIVDYRGSWHNRGRLMFVGWRQALCCWNIRSPPLTLRVPVVPLLLCVVLLHAGMSAFLFCWTTFSFYAAGRTLAVTFIWQPGENHNSFLHEADCNLDSYTFTHTVSEWLSRLVQ